METMDEIFALLENRQLADEIETSDIVNDLERVREHYPQPFNIVNPYWSNLENYCFKSNGLFVSFKRSLHYVTKSTRIPEFVGNRRVVCDVKNVSSADLKLSVISFICKVEYCERGNDISLKLDIIKF